jgi:hypothetical protein
LRERELRVRCAAERGWPSGESGGGTLRLRAPSEDGEERGSNERDEGHDCRVPSTATARLLPYLLDQRLDERLDLFAIERCL